MFAIIALCISGACSLVQGALPAVLTPTPGSPEQIALEEFKTHYMGVLRDNAVICRQAGLDCPEISVIEPNGAMYAMVRINTEALEGIRDDADFAMQILTEENLFVLPGKIFGMDSFVRVVICLPPEKLADAFSRIKNFCTRRKKHSVLSSPKARAADESAKRSAVVDVNEEKTAKGRKRAAAAEPSSSVDESEIGRGRRTKR